MKVTIDIPKEFEDHWKDDKFEDSLNRLKADAHCLAWNYEKEIVDMLIVAFKNATDAIDIVRCKDCKYHEEATQSGMVYCPTIAGGLVSEDCFCAMWERREDVSNC